MESHSKSVKHSEDESLFLANTGSSITIHKIHPKTGLDDQIKMDISVHKIKALTDRSLTERSLDGTTMYSPISSSRMQTSDSYFTDFCPLHDDKVITANSNGILEAFEFRINNKRFRMIYEMDLR